MDPDVCVVIPTIRRPGVVRDYVANARRHGFETDRLFVLFVTEDDCDTAAMASLLEELDIDGAVADGTFRRRWFEAHGAAEYRSLIPRRSHAQTSFGLAYLWATPSFRYGVMIDDDTRPLPGQDFFGGHLAVLQRAGSTRSLRGASGWVNVLHDAAPDLYPRGHPYGAMGQPIEATSRRLTRGDVAVSQGLWTEVPDLDAVRILAEGGLEGRTDIRLGADDFGDGFVAEPGSYLTVCSMNVAFRREVVPAFYQLPMDDNPWDIGRFDDIWSGVFLKRVLDAVGGFIHTGDPLVKHEKAPRSTFDDLAAEAPALSLNEHLWRVVEAIDLDDLDAGPDRPRAAADGGRRDGAVYAEAYRRLADGLARSTVDDVRNPDFVPYMAEHMHEWLDLLDHLEGRQTPKELSGFRSP
ncbi:MAG: alpha-1 4-glucan-protein synthase [Halobacteriota archaeon]